MSVVLRVLRRAGKADLCWQRLVGRVKGDRHDRRYRRTSSVRRRSADAGLQRRRDSGAGLPPLPGGARAGAGRDRSVRARSALLPFGPCRPARQAFSGAAGHRAAGAGRHLRSVVGQGDHQPAVPGRRRASAATGPVRQGLHTTNGCPTARHHGRRDGRPGRTGRRERPLRRGRRPRAALSRPDHLRAARRAARGLATVLVVG